jgi:WD40 repeat protein
MTDQLLGPEDDALLVELLVELERRADQRPDAAFEELLATCQQGRQQALSPGFIERLKSQFAAMRRVTTTLFGLSESTPLSATQVPGYELCALLGHGGVGVVYRARQLSLGRDVALKLMLGGRFASPRMRERFRLEAETAGRLQHPHIAHIHDHGEVDGLPYLVEELVRGGTLAERIHAHRHDPREAARLVETIAEAVHYAHQNGVVHRDLKPSNVLLTDSGQPKITDFGLAKVLDTDSVLTRSGEMPGTPKYMAPEQVSQGMIGPATDVYGLGAILFELLTGQPPFASASLTELYRQILHEPPRVRKDPQRKLPSDLLAIALKCLEKDPRRRYASAAALARDLRRFLEGRTTEARPLSAFLKTSRWMRRRPAAAALMAILGATAVAAIVVVVWHSHQMGVALSIAQARRQEALAAQRQSLAHQRTIRRQLYAADLPQAYREWQRGQVSSALARLNRHVPRDGDEDLRGFAWRHLWQLCHNEDLRLTGHVGPVFTAEFSPDGKHTASVGSDGTLRLWNAATGARLAHVQAHRGDGNCVAYSPDGRYLVTVGEDARICLWDYRALLENPQSAPLRSRALAGPGRGVAISPSGRTLAVTIAGDRSSVQLFDAESLVWRGQARAGRGELQGIAFSPDGRWLASAVASDPNQSPVWIFDLRWPILPPVERLLGMHRGRSFDVAFSPDGRQLASVGSDCVVRLWEVSAGRELAALSSHESGRIDGVAYSPDGRTLAAAGSDGTVRVWDLASRQVIASFNGHTQAVWSVVYSPDGQRLMTASSDATVRLWSINRAEARQLLARRAQPVQALDISSDGRLAIAWADGPLEVIPLAESDPAQRWRVDGLAVESLAFSADGHRLATGGRDGSVRLWDAKSGRAEHQLGGHKYPVSCVCFSVDGRQLVSAAYGEAAWWDLVTGETLPMPEAFRGLDFIARNDKGSLWVGIDDESFKPRTMTWTNSTPLRPRSWPGASGCLAIAPDGKQFCAAGSPIITLWNPQGEQIGSLTGSADRIRGLAFTPDGQTLASTGNDSRVALWDLATQQQLLELSLGDALGTELAFSPDGTKLVVAVEHPNDPRRRGEVHVIHAPRPSASGTIELENHNP